MKKLILISILALFILIVGCQQQPEDPLVQTEEELNSLSENELDLALAAASNEDVQSCIAGEAIKVLKCKKTTLGVDYSKRVKLPGEKTTKIVTIPLRNKCKGKTQRQYFCSDSKNLDWKDVNCGKEECSASKVCKSENKGPKGDITNRGVVSISECTDSDGGNFPTQAGQVDVKYTDGTSEKPSLDYCRPRPGYGLHFEKTCGSNNKVKPKISRCNEGCNADRTACLTPDTPQAPEVEQPEPQAPAAQEPADQVVQGNKIILSECSNELLEDRSKTYTLSANRNDDFQNTCYRLGTGVTFDCEDKKLTGNSRLNQIGFVIEGADVTLRNCKFKNIHSPIRVQAGPVSLENNEIQSATRGIDIKDTVRGRVILDGNQISRAQVAINIESTSVELRNNQLTNNVGTGIKANNLLALTLESNRVCENPTSDINLEGSDNVQIIRASENRFDNTNARDELFEAGNHYLPCDVPADALTINRCVREVASENGKTYVIAQDISAELYAASCVRITGNDVTLDCLGNSITSTVPNERAIGVNIEGNNVRVKNCRLVNFGTGISIRQGPAEIQENTIEGSQVKAIHVTNLDLDITTPRIAIEDNTISGGEEGIELNTKTAVLRRNQITNTNGVGLRANALSSLVLENNVICNNRVSDADFTREDVSGNNIEDGSENPTMIASENQLTNLAFGTDSLVQGQHYSLFK